MVPLVNGKQLVREALRRAGYEITRIPVGGSLELEVAVGQVLRAREITTVVDIGAHEGGYGAMLRRLGFAGRIVSFEPAPSVAARLAARADDGWIVKQLAVGERDEQAVLLEYPNGQLSSLHAPSQIGTGWWGMADATRTPVTVRRLDAVARDLGLTPQRTFVKIDTQGHDLSVIAGGRTFLADAVGLQIEIPMFQAYEAEASWDTLLGAAFDLGFHLVGLFPLDRRRLDG